VNNIIGAMVGAYDAVVAVWEQLPNQFGRIGKLAWNALMDGLSGDAITMNNWLTGYKDVSLGFDFSDFKQKVDEVEAGAEKAAHAAYQARQGVDYVGEIGGVVSKGASAAADKLRALADGLGKTEKAKKKAKSEAEKLAEKYDRLVASATEFIRAQELEASVLGMTEQAANALRYEQDLLNEARRAGLKLTEADKQGFKALADSMAEAEERTRVLRDAFDFTKDTVKGFFSDLRSGLDQGKSFWDAFADAAVNALNKIAEKLIDMALDQMINSVFQGLMGAFGGAGYSPAASAAIKAGVGGLYADGGYTGPGAASQPAGIVHAGEYVMSKRAVDRLGIGYLDALHNAAKGYQTGGLVTPFYSAANSNLPGFDRGGYVPSAPSYAYAGNAAVAHQPVAEASRAGMVVNIIDQREAGAPEVEQRETVGADGTRQLDILIRRTTQDEVGRPSAATNRQLRGAYGLSNQVVRR
jgi:phage-related minor tail protein